MKWIVMAALLSAAFLSPLCKSYAQDSSADPALILETVSVSEASDLPDADMFNPGAHHFIEMPVAAQAGQETLDLLSAVPAMRASSQGNRLQRASVGYRGAAPQDVVVRYQGVQINALSDASADLALIPQALVSRARISGSGALAAFGADGALIDLYADRPDAPFGASVAASSLRDFSLFGRGRYAAEKFSIDGAVFGDLAPGRFAYLDAQDTHRIREHNAASRLGGQVMGHVDLPEARLEAFTLFSRIDREEAGLSEYPGRYRNASEALWISLSQVRANFAPLNAGRADMMAGVSVSHRAFGDVYDNPTAMIGSRPVHAHYLENQTSALVDLNFFVESWSQTVVQAGYECQNVALERLSFGQMMSHDVTDHQLMLSVTENMSFFQDTLLPSAGVRMDWKIGRAPQVSPVIAIQYVPHPSVRLFGSVSHAGRYPSFDELYFESEFLRGNASLKPQRSMVSELGARWQPHEAFRLSVSGFYNLYWDLIRFVPVTSYLFEAVNLSRSFARGVEASADLKLWRFELSASYAFADARVGERLLPGVSRHQVRASAAYRDAIFDVRLDASYQSPVIRNLLGTSFIPAKLRLDVSAEMRLYRGLRLSMSVKNLLDDRRSEDVLQRPLAGRHAFVSLVYEPQSVDLAR